MTALIWAQGRQLMRLRQQWQTLLLLVVFAFIGLVAAIWVWISENVFLKPLPNRQVFWLVLAFLSSLPSFADPQNFIPRLPEWKLAQPIPARTMTVFLWLSEFANLFCFSLLLTLPAIVSASIVLKGAADVAAITMLVVVIALNACLGAALASLEMTRWRTKLALVGRLWRMWARALAISAIVLFVLFVVYLKAHIDWVKFVGWVETPVGMVILLPLMPAYHAIKAAFDGVIAVPILLTLFLAGFTAIMVWQALEVAAPFCEATFLRSERRQRLTKMGAWDAVTQEFVAKPIKSESGFGLKATSLLWLYWLNWKRNSLWAGELPALFIILFSAFVVEKGLPFPSLAIVILLLFYRVFFPHPPEWLKSQPISAGEAVLILALPSALRASGWSLAILFTLALLSPKGIGIANFFAFFLAMIALGFGIDFVVQALRASWWTKFQDFPWLAFVIAIVLGNLMFLTLTDHWLLGLLLSWAACIVLYLWAKERWLKEP